ncbi:MAG: T9SS type A sorting domain-containing protein [Owenweeksia sp.]|nr:T9SS type A sorting domain-containing protein [Owenweeksia sp.]
MSPSGDGIIVAWQDKLLQTGDGGTTWQSISKADTNLIFSKLEGVNGHVYALGQNNADTTSGLYYSGNWGSSWQSHFIRNSGQSGIVDLSIPTANTGYLATWQKIYKNGQLISLPLWRLEWLGLYPNPSQDWVELVLPENTRVLELRLYDVMGNLVDKMQWGTGAGIRLQIGNLPSGRYFVKVHLEGQGVISTSFLKAP